MVKHWSSAVFIIVSIVIGTCCVAETVEEQTGNWSEVHEYLKARLHLRHRLLDNYSEVLVYLELCNTCPPAGTLRVKFPFSSVSAMSFSVKDSEGNEIQTTSPFFGSTKYDPSPLELILPPDCTMQFCISQNGGGLYQDRALLYLIPGQGWYFKYGENKTYELSATLCVAPSERFEERHWAGELKLPPVRIPIPEAGKDEGVGAQKKTKN